MQRFAMVFLLVALVLVGCSRKPEAQTPRDTSSFARSQLTTMPAVAGSTISMAATVFADSEWKPTVTFPGYEARWLEDATTIAGKTVPAHDEIVSIDGRERSLTSVDEAVHTVVKQQPKAGTMLTASTRIILEAGPHPNDTQAPWLTSGHKFSIRDAGTMECFKCHTETSCSDCHTKLMR